MSKELFKIKLWGVRGSLPAPLAPHEIKSRLRKLLTAFIQSEKFELNSGSEHALNVQLDDFLSSQSIALKSGYGGNTSCTEVATDQIRVAIDGGSGLRAFGADLLHGPLGKGKGEFHLFFTHYHWDHLMGLPFFVPLFIPGNQIHFYGVDTDLRKVFEMIFQKPYFPLQLKDLGATLHFHNISPRKPCIVGDLSFTPYRLDHPDPCYGYRVEAYGKAYSHCVDTEAVRTSRKELGDDLPLYQGVDLMVFDSQYTLEEAIEKVNWGHAAATIGLDIAMREGIKKIAFVHFDPAASDEKILAAWKQADRYYRGRLKESKRSKYHLHEVDWHFAVEGTEYIL